MDNIPFKNNLLEKEWCQTNMDLIAKSLFQPEYYCSQNKPNDSDAPPYLSSYS